VHGTSYNPLVTLIARLNIDYYYDDGTPLYFTEFGATGPQFKSLNVADEFTGYLEYFTESQSEAADVSADTHIRRWLAQHEFISDDERNWAPEALRLHELTVGLTMEEASSQSLANVLTAGRDLYVKGGYDRVVNHVAEPIVTKEGILQLKHVVDEVSWGGKGSSQVKIKLHHQDEQQTLTADAVIITVPLGVLKTEKFRFDPPLADDLAEGLTNMSYGVLGKVFFEFEEVFWSRDHDTLTYFPTPPSLNDDSQKGKYPVLGSPFYVPNLYTMTGAAKLCVLMSPPVTHKIEALAATEGGEMAVFEYFEPLLKLFRTEPNRPLPKLVQAKVTAWTRDEHAGFGAYSTARVGDDPELWWDALDAHKRERVQFAGEHCSREFWGEVNGAYETGEAAAMNVLRIVGRA
jgi:polyamine oxidase